MTLPPRSRPSPSLTVALLVIASVGAVLVGGTGTAAAAPTPITECTIIDQPGHYELTANITNPSHDACLTIETSDVTIDGNGYRLTGDGYVGVDVDNGFFGASNVTLTDLTINGSNIGVRTSDVDGVSIRGLTVTNSLVGVRLVNTYNTTLTDSTLAVTIDGIVVNAGSSPTHIANSTITGDHTGSDDTGIHLISLLGNDTVTNTTIDGFSQGIHVVNSDGTQLTENTVEWNTAGIHISRTTRFELRENTVQSNTGDGITLAASTGGDLSGNTIRGIVNTAGSGIVVQDGAVATLRNTTIRSPGDHGIFVNTGGDVRISDATITDSGSTGIGIYNATATVHRAVIMRPGFNGIGIGDGATAVTVDDSVVHNADTYGIAVGDSTNATITNNHVLRGAQGGIAFLNSTGTATGNVVDADGLQMDVGLTAKTNATATFVDNAVSAVDRAVTVDNSAATIRTLRADSAAVAGLTVVNDAAVTLDEATITSITGPAITVHESTITAADVHISAVDRGVISEHSTTTLRASTVTNTANESIRFVASSGAVTNTSISRVDASETSAQGHGIRMDAGSQFTIENVTVSEVSGNGIYVLDGSRGTVQDSVIAGGGDGIRYVSNSHGTVTRSVVTAGDTDAAVAVVGSAFVAVTDNVLRNTHQGVSFGAGSGIVLHNRIENVDRGVDVRRGSPRIWNNSITNVTEYGAVFDLATADLHANTIQDAGTAGVYLTGHSTGTIAENVIDAQWLGVRLSESASAELRQNDITASTGFLLDADAHVVATSVAMNDLEQTTLYAIKNENASAPASLDAVGNWYGPRGPVNTSLTGAITYEPFLTAPPDTVAATDIQAFGFDLALSAGQVYAVGTPADTATPLAEMFGAFEGAIYLYDAQQQSWSLATGTETLGAMDAVAVVPTTDAHVVVDFADATPPRPAGRQLSPGWQFVAPRAYDGIEAGFSTRTVGITDVSQSMAAPQGQPAPPGASFGHYSPPSSPSGDGPRVSPFTGYFVYVDDPGVIPGRVLSGERMREVRVHLGLNATIAETQ